MSRDRAYRDGGAKASSFSNTSTPTSVMPPNRRTRASSQPLADPVLRNVRRNAAPVSMRAPQEVAATASMPMYIPRQPLVTLPISPVHTRPPAQLFGWGNADEGVLGEGITRPQFVYTPARNKWVESRIEQGAFGGPGAGLETVAAGGFHTLFVDEVGTVCFDICFPGRLSTT